MKKSSKILAVLLAASMVFSIIGCGKQEVSGTESTTAKESETTANTTVSTEAQEDLYYNETGYPICDEPITITVSGNQGTTTDWQNTVLVKTIEEKLGIKLVCEPISSDAFKTQYALMLSENDVPDLMINSSVIPKAQSNQDGEAGYWLDLNEYMDLMPNLKAYIEKYPEIKAYHATETGAIYSLNRNTASDINKSNAYIIYDKKLVESLGITEIKSVDDLYNALVAVKAAYPDKTPFAMAFNGGYFRADWLLANAFGMETWSSNYSLYPNENGSLVLGEATENGRAYFSYMNKLYEEKLLDNESYLYSKDEYSAKIDEGKFVFWTSDSLDYDNAISNKPEDFGIINVLTSEYCEEPTLVMNHGLTAGSRIMVSANTEYPEAICRLIDFLFTEEGIQLTTTGIEGETFEFIEDAKYGYKQVSYDKFADLKNFDSTTAWRNQKVVIFQGMAMRWGWENAWADDLSVETAEKMVSDAELDPAIKVQAMYKLLYENVEKKVKILPPFTYTDAESTEMATLKTDVTTFIDTCKTAFIAGDMDIDDDKQWNAYLDSLNEMGLERLLSIEQAAYDRMSANN